MDSNTLANIINAAMRVRAHGWDGVFRDPVFMLYLARLDKLDAARRFFYGHDDASLAIFDWRTRQMITESLYGFPLPYELDNAPFTTQQWQGLEQQAAAMTDGFAADDYLLDRINVWLLHSYALPGCCEAGPGDTVLDCGAYTGNTTLYFSQKVGPHGHVYGFEASKDTFTRYRANVGHLPNCTPVRCAVAGKSGVVTFSGAGADSRISEHGEETAAVSLDDFVRKQKIERVDFIKMDIEGAEDEALQGASAIIRRFRPRMAISGYHKPFDLYDLPSRIIGIDSRYTFRLGHYSNRSWETVIFCIPDDKPMREYAHPSPYELDDTVRKKFSGFLAEIGLQTPAGHKKDGENSLASAAFTRYC